MKAECEKRTGMESRETVIRDVCWRRAAEREDKEGDKCYSGANKKL